MAAPVNPGPNLDLLHAQLVVTLYSYRETPTNAGRMDALREAIDTLEAGLLEERSSLQGRATLWSTFPLGSPQDCQHSDQIAKSASAYYNAVTALATAKQSLQENDHFKGYLFLCASHISKDDRIPREEAERRVVEASQQEEFRDKIPFVFTWCPNRTHIILVAFEKGDVQRHTLILRPSSRQWELVGQPDAPSQHVFDPNDVMGSLYRNFGRLYSAKGFLAVDPARRVQVNAAAVQ